MDNFYLRKKFLSAKRPDPPFEGVSDICQESALFSTHMY